MPKFSFAQVDVFTSVALKGNPLAVVMGADGLRDDQMAALANWTNLSETAFLLAPTVAGADYRVRIFTPAAELLFAGHPTLGSCHTWLAAGGRPKSEEIVQECAVGLVRIRQSEGRLAFAAPPADQRAVEPKILTQIAGALGVAEGAILDAQWLGKAPGWVAVRLGSREEVLAIEPDYRAMGALKIGVVAPCAAGETQFEVRAFAPDLGLREDPVTGSLNAGLARWLIGSKVAPSRYVAAQGTRLGRDGRIYVEQSGDDFWIGGYSVTCIEGVLTL